MTSLTQKDIARFWGKIDKEKSNIFYNGTRCWEWTAHCDKHNYGKMWLNGRSDLAHRISYELHYGKIANNLSVLHHCDNPICCNPEHHFLGTRADNVYDMDRKKEGPSGRKAQITSFQINRLPKFVSDMLGTE